MPSTPYLLRDGEEAADDKGTVGVRLTPGLDLTAVLGIVSDNEESCQQIAGEGRWKMEDVRCQREEG
jgi:hypothetical protein